MPDLSLHIFAKDRDATATEMGYEFQRLKTLEQWLYNKVHKVEEEIYYDYGDDIFQSNSELGKVQFRQLKLYSSKNFSFASEEIIKAISHFFFLFLKQEEEGNEASFVFETNTSIAQVREDNDAALLKDWAANQGKVSKELLLKCKEKVKSIVDAYVEEQYNKLRKEEETKAQAEAEKERYQQLSQEVWEKFVNVITWNFSNISSEDSLSNTIASIQDLIAELPFPISRTETDTVFARLYREVGDKATKIKPSERKLTNPLIDGILLSMGDDDDKEYKRVFENWQDHTIQLFTVGEFYEGLFTARYCRRHAYLKEHSSFWLDVLTQYCKLDECPRSYKREAAYEIAWLSLRPTFARPLDGNLLGCEDIIRDYFNDFEAYDNSRHLEEALNLLNITVSCQITGRIALTEQEVRDLIARFTKAIKAKVDSEGNLNEKCRFIELQAFFHLSLVNWKILDATYGDVMDAFRKIIPILPKADLYAVSQLNRRLSDIVRQLISAHASDDGITAIEKFQDDLGQFVKERESDFSNAKTYIDRGAAYVQRNDKQSMLKALDYFHKAKELWYQEDWLEGYTLALINISQLYSAIGLNLAAKYYGLCAFWVAINANDPKLYKRISDASGLLFYADYKQGSWINALHGFDRYFNAKIRFDSKQLDDYGDLWQSSLVELMVILFTAPVISPQLHAFIEFYKEQMGAFYEEYIKEALESSTTEKVEKLMHDVVKSRIDGEILNDVGEIRRLAWKAFGSEWIISFPNDFVNNSIAEEFCAMLQIVQADFSLQGIDLHLIKTTVRVDINVGETILVTQHPTNKEYHWIVALPQIDVSDSKKIGEHYARLGNGIGKIFRELSLLPEEKFRNTFQKLFLEQGLASKTLSVNAYQRMYRKIFQESEYTDSRRASFQSVTVDKPLQENSVLLWNGQVSELYSQDSAKNNIAGRYRNGIAPIRRTLEKIKGEAAYSGYINNLRTEGYKDWQIFMSLMNSVVNLKAQFYAKAERHETEEKYLEALNKWFGKLLKEEETQSYGEIPIDVLFESEMPLHLSMLPMHVLGSFGLESASRFPNTVAIRDLLNAKFNFDKDDMPDLSPL